MKIKLLSLLLTIQMVVMLVIQADPITAAAAGAPSAAPSASQAAVFNIAGANGFVKVTGLTSGDVVKVYSASAGGSSIGSGSADSNGVATVDVGPSALAPAGGSVYVTVTGSGDTESARTQVAYPQQILPWQVYSHTGNWGENYQWSSSSNRNSNFTNESPDGTAAHEAYPAPSGHTLYPAYPTLRDVNNNPYTDDDLSQNVFLNKHIVIKGTGSRVSFYGYGYPGYNDFILLPIAGTDEKDVSFSFDLSTVSFHTLYGAGFLFNVVDNGNGTINGYALLFHGGVSSDISVEDASQRTIELYKLTNVNKNSLSNSTSSTTFLGAASGIAKVASIGVTGNSSAIFPAGGGFLNNNMHYMKLQLRQVSGKTELIVQNSSTQNGPYTTVMDDNTLNPASASGVGLIASYINHGCSILSYLTFNDVSIKTVCNSVETTEGWPIVDLSASSGAAVGQTALTFTAPSDAASVILQQSTDGTNWSTAATSSPILPSSSSAVVTGLTNGTKYSYRLLVDGGSYAGISNVATVTPSGTQSVVEVTFDSGSADTPATPASEVVNPITHNLGTLPTPPVKAGYAFQGWSTDSSADATPDFNATTSVTASKTVYAVWLAYTATATPMYLNYGGSTPSSGSTGGSTSSSSSGGNCTLTATPSEGYTFAGWYTNGACTNLASTASPYTTTLSGNTTFYALFKQTPALSIMQQPTGASYHNGEPIDALSVAVSATNGGTLSYQWYAEDAAIADSNSSTYTPSFPSDGTYHFHCVVTETASGFGSATITSSTATILYDSTPPSGTITVAQDSWSSFLNTITFGHFFKGTQSVNISASDNGSGVAQVQYLLSSDPIAAADIAGMTGWADGDSFSIASDCKKIVYARITDNVGNVAYINSDGLVFDTTHPTISAAVSGSFANGYKIISATCADQGSGIASAMWRPGSYTAGTFDTNGANAISGDNFQVTSAGDYTVYVVDNAGNAFVRIVTVSKDAQAGFGITDTGAKTFGDPSFTLSAAGGNGSGNVTFSVPANNGVLTLNGSTTTIIGTGIVTVTAAKAADQQYDAATAIYTLKVSPVTYSITANAYYKNSGDAAYQKGSSGGTVSAAQSSVINGETVTLTATPAAGYRFDGWFMSSQGGTPLSTETTFSTTVSGSRAYYALFSETGYTISGSVQDDQQQPQPVSNALVYLTLAGKTVAGPVSTDSEGNFALAGVPVGTYDLVVNYTDVNHHMITVTQIVSVTGNVTIGKITIPTGQKNTVFVPSGGPTVNAVANLDSVYHNVNGNTDPTLGVTMNDLKTVNDGGSVTIKVVTSSVDNTAEQNQADAVTNAAQSDSRVIGMQLDISALKQVTPLNMSTTTTNLSQLNNLITIYIPLPPDMQGKAGYIVYRYHGSNVDKITETPNAAGEYFTINGNILALTVQKFCVYALAYSGSRQVQNPTTGGNASQLPVALAIFTIVSLPFMFHSKFRRRFRAKKGPYSSI